MNILSPSLLSVDFCNIERDAGILDENGVKWFHLDVMDGNFVANISFGPPVIKSIRKVTNSFFDVHLMIQEPIRYIDVFKDAGADSITIHYEACQDLDKTIDKIKEAGLKVGVSIKPETPVDVLEKYIDKVDMILVMSVNPGFGGQVFIPSSLDKIKTLREYANDKNPKLHIQVDGGITIDNVKEVLDAGANVIVAGSAVFKGDKAANIKAFFDVMSE